MKLKTSMYQTITEFAVYKYFSFFDYGMVILICVLIGLLQFFKKDTKIESIKQAIVIGLLAGIIFYLPRFLSAVIMRWMEKPVLKFDVDGFYYMPQIWSKRTLYEWNKVKEITIKYYPRKWYHGKTSYPDRYVITVYFLNKKNVSFEFCNTVLASYKSVMPISIYQFIELLRYRLKNVPIKTILK